MKNSGRVFVAVGSIVCGTGVLLGAFGAHGLRGKIAESALATFQSGVLYQLVHGLAIITVGLSLPGIGAKKLATAAGWLFLVGVLLFSFSLYLLAVADLVLPLLPPLGGVSFVAGWACLAIASMVRPRE